MEIVAKAISDADNDAQVPEWDSPQHESRDRYRAFARAVLGALGKEGR